MSHSVNSTFDFLVKLGFLRQQDVQTARQLLGTIKNSSAGADGANGEHVKLAGPSMPSDEKNHSVPGQDSSTLAKSPGGIAILLAAAVILSKADERTNIASRVVGADEPNESPIKKFEAITTALAHLLTAGNSPKQISLIADGVNHEMNSVGNIKLAEDHGSVIPHSAGADGENLSAPPGRNQGSDIRLKEAQGEINTARFETTENIPEIQLRKTGQAPGDLADAVDLASREKANTMARILEHTLPLHRAFDRLAQRMSQVEAQLHQTPYNGS